MQDLFKKNQILTIPNLLSVVRIALIPLIAWLYSYKRHYYAAIGVILLSGATDIVDGWIARHFHMISDFGKALDPLADKLTQGALCVCLSSKYDLILWLIVLFCVCELSKLTLGILVAKKCNQVTSARWYGKCNTVFIYLTMILLILFPELSPGLANAMIVTCGMIIVIAHILYFRFYSKLLIGHKAKSNEQEDAT